MVREAMAERRPTLTAPARGGIRHVWVGAKKRAAKSNKETGMKEVKNAVTATRHDGAVELIFNSANSQAIERTQKSTPEKRLGTTFCR
jgi:hypothetical protein